MYLKYGALLKTKPPKYLPTFVATKIQLFGQKELLTSHEADQKAIKCPV